MDFILIADVFVFKTYRFHIDLMFIDMFINDFRGIGLSPFIVIVSVLITLAIIAVNVFIFRIAGRIKIPFVKHAYIFLILLFVFGQAVHIWGFKFNRQYITRYTPYYPYYFPTTSNRLISNLSEKFPVLIPENFDANSDDSIFDTAAADSGLFNYPRNSIRVNDTLKTKKNILLFVLESWRFDMLKKDVMPNVYDLAQRSYVFKNHFSGGNVTISGLFSMMYGIHASYMNLAQSNPAKYSTVLTTTLDRYGYNTGVYVSQNFDRFALKTMFFNNVKPENYHSIYKGKTE
jgi:membrane-anchored protein YejM (alkaline phosphatase superfamily)